MSKMAFPRNLSLLRRSKGITQEMLAEKCGVSRQAVTKWECGSSLPDLYKLLEIADFLGVSTDELIKGQEENILLDSVMEKASRISERMAEIEECMSKITMGQRDDEEEEIPILLECSLFWEKEGICDYLYDEYVKNPDTIFEIALREASDDADLDVLLYLLYNSLIRGYIPAGFEAFAQIADSLRRGIFNEERYPIEEKDFHDFEGIFYTIRMYVNIMEALMEIIKENPEMHTFECGCNDELEKYLENYYTKLKERESGS